MLADFFLGNGVVFDDPCIVSRRVSTKQLATTRLETHNSKTLACCLVVGRQGLFTVNLVCRARLVSESLLTLARCQGSVQEHIKSYCVVSISLIWTFPTLPPLHGPLHYPSKREEKKSIGSSS